MRMRKPVPKIERATETSKPAGQALPSTLRHIVDLLVENRIRIDAMEQILVKTNSVAYPLYLDTIENLRGQQAAEVTRVLTQTVKSKLSEG